MWSEMHLLDYFVAIELYVMKVWIDLYVLWVVHQFRATWVKKANAYALMTYCRVASSLQYWFNCLKQTNLTVNVMFWRSFQFTLYHYMMVTINYVQLFSFGLRCWPPFSIAITNMYGPWRITFLIKINSQTHAAPGSNDVNLLVKVYVRKMYCSFKMHSVPLSTVRHYYYSYDK